MIAHFVKTVMNDLKDETQAVSTAITNGQAASYEQYRYMLGLLAGLEAAARIIDQRHHVYEERS
jgi:hypothetical protein